MYNPFLPIFYTSDDLGDFLLGKQDFYLGKPFLKRALLRLEGPILIPAYLYYYNLGWLDSFYEQN